MLFLETITPPWAYPVHATVVPWFIQLGFLEPDIPFTVHRPQTGSLGNNHLLFDFKSAS